MKESMSISNIRAKSKSQLLGNYRVASGAFVLMLMIVYAISSMLMNAYSDNMSMLGLGGIGTGSLYTGDAGNFLIDFVISNLVSIAANIFSDLLNVGFIFIIYGIASGKMTRIGDLFYCFKHHPDKVIIMSVIFSAASIIFTLPANLVGAFGDKMGMSSTAGVTALYIGLIILGNIAYMIFFLNFAMCYIIYIKDSEKTAIECMVESKEMMKGNKVRYFVLMLSLIGYFILGIVSFGIGLMYVFPLKEMAVINLYRDITGEEITAETVNGQENMDYWK